MYLSTSCSRPLKDNTQSYYQSSSFVRDANHVNESQSPESRVKSVRNESSQGKHRNGRNLTHGMSRTETFNRPALLSEPCPLKDTTQSYCYSSEDEFERVERKEKERYERRLVREHLRQKSRDELYEYRLESFEYAGRNLVDTDETDGGITVSDWSEPDLNEGHENDEDEIFVGYFEDSEALQEDEPIHNDPQLIQPIGNYRNMGQVDQKPTHFTLCRTEIPLPPGMKPINLDNSEPEQNALPETTIRVEPLSREVKQEAIGITGIFRRPASVRSDPIISRQQFLVYAFERITSSRLAVDKSECNLEFWVASRQGIKHKNK